MSYKFKCPYCFAECEDDKVYFRATHFFDDRQIHAVMADAEDPERDIKQLFVKNSKDSPKVRNLIRFWESKGAEAGYISDPGWNMPYIDPTDDRFAEMIRATETGRLQVGADGFVRDQNGFVLRVVDRYGSEFQPMKRLCPHCLNPFPLEDYGKREIKFISVVGTTGAGKTVYLHELLMRFATAMAGTNYKIEASNLSDIGEHVDPDHPLPGATDTRIMRRPLAVNLQADERHGGKKMTLVFYDVAGEHFSRKENGEEESGSTGVTDYIRYSDAIMILIDPAQISFLTSEGRARMADDVQKTIEVLFKLRGDWKGIPAAVVLTKSDTLENMSELGRESEIFHHIDHNLRNAASAGFQRDNFAKVNCQIRNLLEEYAKGIYHTVDQMDHPAFFAVSAITCGVVWKFEKNKHYYQLSEDDFKDLNRLRAWVMYEWNGEGQMMSREELLEMRRHAPKPPCALSCEIPVEQDITTEFAATVETGLYGERYAFDQTMRYRLTLADVMEMNVLGYPASDPNPRRVEEPLQWILWRMGLLDPTFMPEPEPCEPKKGIRGFFGKKSGNSQQWSDEWAAASEEARRLFYDGAEDYTAPYDAFRKSHRLQ